MTGLERVICSKVIATLIISGQLSYAAHKPSSKIDSVKRRESLFFSLEKERLIYLHRIEDFNQQISIYKSKKKLRDEQLVRYYQLLKQQSHALYVQDSIRLTIAKSYLNSEQIEEAEEIYAELVKSLYPEIRQKATSGLKFIIAEKKPKFYNQWPWKTITAVVEPGFFIIIASILLIVFFWVSNRTKSRHHFDVLCGDNQERVAFKEAVSMMLQAMLQRTVQGTAGGVVPPGMLSVLPHLITEGSSGIAGLVEVVASDGYLKFLGLIKDLGLNPKQVLQILIEKGGTQTRIKATLRIADRVIYNWDETVVNDQLFDKRLDIAYEALVKIQNSA